MDLEKILEDKTWNDFISLEHEEELDEYDDLKGLLSYLKAQGYTGKVIIKNTHLESLKTKNRLWFDWVLYEAATQFTLNPDSKLELIKNIDEDKLLCYSIISVKELTNPQKTEIFHRLKDKDYILEALDDINLSADQYISLINQHSGDQDFLFNITCKIELNENIVKALINQSDDDYLVKLACQINNPEYTQNFVDAIKTAEGLVQFAKEYKCLNSGQRYDLTNRAVEMSKDSFLHFWDVNLTNEQKMELIKKSNDEGTVFAFCRQLSEIDKKTRHDLYTTKFADSKRNIDKYF